MIPSALWTKVIGYINDQIVIDNYFKILYLKNQKEYFSPKIKLQLNFKI